ncbi:gnat family protein [Fusarium circinatum]|uniref:Gnat family protein n=1 Tax=Fusarium circinatum TaxID=48490 RepID=A0A8H5WN33_FUSCI|nr:gnat family protein [Fusarium circinatum]
MVATAPDLMNPKETKAISLSIWDNPGYRGRDPDIPAVAPPKNHPERKDCNPARLKAYSEATMKARKDIFVSSFGERQLSLRQMATHPDYWKRAIPMFAGNMGKLLYAKFGFKELGRVKIQVPGESEAIYEIAMVWNPHDESGKGSGRD